MFRLTQGSFLTEILEKSCQHRENFGCDVSLARSFPVAPDLPILACAKHDQRHVTSVAQSQQYAGRTESILFARLLLQINPRQCDRSQMGHSRAKFALCVINKKRLIHAFSFNLFRKMNYVLIWKCCHIKHFRNKESFIIMMKCVQGFNMSCNGVWFSFSENNSQLPQPPIYNWANKEKIFLSSSYITV